MTTTARSISVVMPNYNHADELEVSLAAVVKQTRRPDEILVVDDGSTDHSLAVIERFARDCPQLRVIVHEKNQGVVEAVKRGVREATGEYIILASADECIMPEMTAAMCDAVEQFPDARLVVSKFTEWFADTGHLQHGANGECDLWFADDEAPQWVCAERFHALLAKRHVRLSVNSAMFTRSALLDVDVFYPELRWHSDWFAIYATALRHGFCAVPRVLSWFRVAAQSYSVQGTSAASQQRELVSQLLDKLDEDRYADVRAALMRSPSAMTPFLRPLMLTMLKQPTRYGSLARVGAWWLGQVGRGRQPRGWANSAPGRALHRLFDEGRNANLG